MISNKEKTKLVKKFNERFADIQRKLGQDNQIVKDYQNKIRAVLGDRYLDKSFSGNWKINTDHNSKLLYTEESLQKLLHELPTYGQLKYQAEQEEGRKLTAKEFKEIFKNSNIGKELYEFIILYVNPSDFWQEYHATVHEPPAWPRLAVFCKSYIRARTWLLNIWNQTHGKGERL